MPSESIRVLFVCLGNICRSPLAEGLFIKHLQNQQVADRFVVDSAGTGNYHTGELPDERTRSNARSHGLELTSRARTFVKADFERFDHILVMDRQNEQRVLALACGSEEETKVKLMRDLDPEPEDGQVPDPWFGGEEGFELVYQILDRSTLAFLTSLHVEPAA